MSSGAAYRSNAGCALPPGCAGTGPGRPQPAAARVQPGGQGEIEAFPGLRPVPLKVQVPARW